MPTTSEHTYTEACTDHPFVPEHFPVQVIPSGMTSSNGEFIGPVTGWGIYTQEVDGDVLMIADDLKEGQAKCLAYALNNTYGNTDTAEKADWYVRVENDDADEDEPTDLWVHISQAAGWCVEEVRFGVPDEESSHDEYEAWFHVEACTQ